VGSSSARMLRSISCPSERIRGTRTLRGGPAGGLAVLAPGRAGAGNSQRPFAAANLPSFPLGPS
jgi:hypothetical protein